MLLTRSEVLKNIDTAFFSLDKTELFVIEKLLLVMESSGKEDFRSCRLSAQVKRSLLEGNLNHHLRSELEAEVFEQSHVLPEAIEALGFSYQENLNYENALNCFRRALTLYEAEGNLAKVHLCKFYEAYLTKLSFQQPIILKLQELLDSSLENNQGEVAVLIFIQMVIEKISEKNTNILEFVNQYKFILENHKSKLGIVDFYILYSQDNYQASMECLRKSLARAKETDIKFLFALLETDNDLARLFVESGVILELGRIYPKLIKLNKKECEVIKRLMEEGITSDIGEDSTFKRINLKRPGLFFQENDQWMINNQLIPIEIF